MHVLVYKITVDISEKQKTIRHHISIHGLMAIGFALLSISPLHEKIVYETLRNIPEITEVHPLFGEYDILLKIECGDIDTIGSVVINKIRALKGVMDTKTLIGTRSLGGE